MGIIKKWEVEKICIYPYGGSTIFNTLVNVNMMDELLVLISGPLIQMVFYIFIKNFVNYSDYVVFKKYNYLILFFNLLPIYPLDGGRLVNIVFRLFIPYKKSLMYSISLSLIIVFLLIVYKRTISLYIILLFLLIKIYKEKNRINHIYNKFLLERYMYDFKFKRIKIINRIEDFYFQRKHLIKSKNMYISEKECITRHFYM